MKVLLSIMAIRLNKTETWKTNYVTDKTMNLKLKVYIYAGEQPDISKAFHSGSTYSNKVDKDVP